jgi:hypothetical protein
MGLQVELTINMTTDKKSQIQARKVNSINLAQYETFCIDKSFRCEFQNNKLIKFIFNRFKYICVCTSVGYTCTYSSAFFFLFSRTHLTGKHKYAIHKCYPLIFHLITKRSWWGKIQKVNCAHSNQLYSFACALQLWGHGADPGAHTKKLELRAIICANWSVHAFPLFRSQQFCELKRARTQNSTFSVGYCTPFSHPEKKNVP